MNTLQKTRTTFTTLVTKPQADDKKTLSHTRRMIRIGHEGMVSTFGTLSFGKHETQFSKWMEGICLWTPTLISISGQKETCPCHGSPRLAQHVHVCRAPYSITVPDHDAGISLGMAMIESHPLSFSQIQDDKG